MEAQRLELDERVRRSKGRTSRNRVANTRVTQEEQDELESAAKAEGKALSEWAREVLLHEARARHTDRALFTEVVALRLLLHNVLRPRSTDLSPDEFDKLVTEIRSSKHTTATELLKQYSNPFGGN